MRSSSGEELRENRHSNGWPFLTVLIGRLPFASKRRNIGVAKLLEGRGCRRRRCSPCGCTMNKSHVGVLLFALTGMAVAAGRSGPDEPPAFCGGVEKHRVVGQKMAPGPLPEGSARVYLFWKGMAWRWLRTQCKVALNGRWVAVLSPNTYSVIDVKPGRLRFCAAGAAMATYLAPTWRSLLFLHATAGETHYVECSPGGDDVGAGEPTLSEPEQTDAGKSVTKLRRVSFESKPGR